MSAARDDDIEARLDDIEAHLDDLRADLGTERPPPFRPPTPGEVLRFTEEYTIPTVVASLEATVRALELLQRLLRLADPARAASEERRGVTDRLPTRRRAVERLDETLADLRRALEAADLPPDESARAIVEDAREVTAEIDRLLTDTGEERAQRSVAIDVRDSVEDDRPDDASPPTTDVEAELQSIRDELEGTGEPARDETSGVGGREEGRDGTEDDDG